MTEHFLLHCSLAPLPPRACARMRPTFVVLHCFQISSPGSTLLDTVATARPMMSLVRMLVPSVKFVDVPAQPHRAIDVVLIQTQHQHRDDLAIEACLHRVLLWRALLLYYLRERR